MKKIWSIILMLAMITTTITVSPVQASNSYVNIEEAKNVSVDVNEPYSQELDVENEGRDFLYEVEAKSDGVYVFESSGKNATTQMLFDINETELTYSNCLEYSVSLEADDGEESCKIIYPLKKGEKIYFYIFISEGDICGTSKVNIRNGVEYAEKDGIIYQLNETQNEYAVLKCMDYKIKQVDIPAKINKKRVTEIGKYAFQYCYDLYEVNIPEGIEKIDDWAFYTTELKNVKIPASCKELGDSPFYGTNISTINIPKNVEKIASLSGMYYLEKITVDNKNQKFELIDDVLYTKDKKRLVVFPLYKTCETYTVLEQTESIGRYAFRYCEGVDKIILSDNVKTIEYGAFWQTSIIEIKLGKNVTTIEGGAFVYSINLSYIDIPESVSQIEEHAFQGCENLNVVIRNSQCDLASNMINYGNITIYGVPGSTAEQYAQNNNSVKFIALNPEGCKAEEPSHQMVDVYDKMVKCEEDGITRHLCVNCGKEDEPTVETRLGHDEARCKNYCDRCNKVLRPDELMYIALNEEFLVKGKFFQGNLERVLFGFKAPGTGKYKISLEDEILDESIFYLKDNGKGVNAQVHLDSNDSIMLKEGETLLLCLFSDYNGQSIGGYNIKITCNHSNTETKIIANATCQKEGKKEEVCKICKEVVKTEVLSKVSHKYGTNNKCTWCGKLNESGTVAPTPTTKPSVTPATKPTTNKTIKVGKYTYTLDSNGQYVSKKAKKPSISKLTKSKRSFKIKWKKVSGVNGYQVQYSTSKKFTKKTTGTKTYSGNKKFTKTIKKLKSKKTYYVRVRAYKTTKVSGKSVKVYTSWSKAKSVKTK